MVTTDISQSRFKNRSFSFADINELINSLKSSGEGGLEYGNAGTHAKMTLYAGYYRFAPIENQKLNQKIKKMFFSWLLIVLCTNIFGQITTNYTYERYYTMVDSLLIVFEIKIVQDLALNGYSISEITHWDIQEVSNCFIFEVFFIPKRSNIIALSGTTVSMYNKFLRQNRGFRFVKRAYIETFRRDIKNNNELPYDIIYYFRYRFITPYDSSPINQAIYGEYKFKQNENYEFEISEKNIEVLKGRDAIIQKYKSTF